MMKKYLYLLLCMTVGIAAFTACSDDETYAEQKEKERNAISAFMNRSEVVLKNSAGDTLLAMPRIKVITELEFTEQDSTTNVDENEYVLFSGTGVYMQIVRQGVGERLQDDESKRILCRYWEYNILGDSLQTADNTTYWNTNPEIINVAKSSGTITGSFDTSINGGGAMYQVYKSTTVPTSWLLPLQYVGIGRQTGEEGIAKVRLIVPHSQGQTDATSNVYPCFYEITYQQMRE